MPLARAWACESSGERSPRQSRSLRRSPERSRRGCASASTCRRRSRRQARGPRRRTDPNQQSSIALVAPNVLAIERSRTAGFKTSPCAASRVEEVTGLMTYVRRHSSFESPVHNRPCALAAQPDRCYTRKANCRQLSISCQPQRRPVANGHVISIGCILTNGMAIGITSAIVDNIALAETDDVLDMSNETAPDDPLAAQIARALEEEIVFGRLKPGQKLREEELAERFAGSRHQARGARSAGKHRNCQRRREIARSRSGRFSASEVRQTA